MKKLVILGIGGLVGYRLAEIAKNNFELFGCYKNRNPEFDFVESKEIDITDEKELKNWICSIKPDYIINTCAIHNVEYCETHKDESNKVNVKAVNNIFDISNHIGAKFLHISSDSVFDGEKNQPYTEEDKYHPMNVYGKAKLDGEKIVLQNKNNLVIRASILYGWLPEKLSQIKSSSMKQKNFAQWLIQSLKNNEQVNIITDEISSPIIADDFSKSLIHLIKNNFSGLFHSAPPIQISRYDFSLKISEVFGLNSKLIHPTTNKKLGRKVVTGQNKCLDSEKITNTGYQFMSLSEALGILKKHSLE